MNSGTENKVDYSNDTSASSASSVMVGDALGGLPIFSQIEDTKNVTGKVLSLVPDNNELLHKELPEFVFGTDVNPHQIAHDLWETMKAKQGIGISANQVGLPYRVFVMHAAPPIACFNPRILNSSMETVKLLEGCLTYPGVFVPIERPRQIRVRFQTPNGNSMTRTFEGMTARIFQHEYDHMLGKNFLDRAHRIHRDRALNKLRIIKRRRK